MERSEQQKYFRRYGMYSDLYISKKCRIDKCSNYHYRSEYPFCKNHRGKFMSGFYTSLGTEIKKFVGQKKCAVLGCKFQAIKGKVVCPVHDSRDLRFISVQDLKNFKRNAIRRNCEEREIFPKSLEDRFDTFRTKEYPTDLDTMLIDVWGYPHISNFSEWKKIHKEGDIL